MSWIGGAIGAGGSIAGGLLGSSSAKSASKPQAKATKAAIAEERRQYEVSRADLEPWREAGGSAINRLSTLLGLDGSDTVAGKLKSDPRFQELFAGQKAVYDAAHREKYGIGLEEGESWYLNRGDVKERLDKQFADTAQQEFISRYGEPAAGTPNAGFGDLLKKFTLADFWDDPVTQASYQQGMDQGTKALANMAGARGNRNSGAQLKALTRFGTDYTGNQAAGSQARFVGDQTNLYNRLAGISGTGQTAATNTAQFGQNTANTVGGLLTAQGNARGAAEIYGGNALRGASRNVGNIFANQYRHPQSYTSVDYSNYDRVNDPFGGP